jgi:hypothetical protein
MTDERRHTVRLSDAEVVALERSVRTRHGVLALTGEMRSTEQVKQEADQLAIVGALVQEHMRGGCDCALPSNLPPPPGRRRPIPIEDRKVV